jgi:1-acyl-sn-glycerol-3-phosphate acyltransferase
MPKRLNTSSVPFLITAAVTFGIGIYGSSYVEYMDKSGGHTWNKNIDSGRLHDHKVASVRFGVIAALIPQIWPHIYRGRWLLPVASILLIFAGAACEPDQNQLRETYITLVFLATGISLGLFLRAVSPFRWHARIVLALAFAYLTMLLPFELVRYVWRGFDEHTPPPLALLGGLAFLVSCIVCRRPLVELGFEIPSRICYRIRGHGPGLKAFPRGPVVVIANHASYMDPLFLAGDVPRPITPMMTSKFFDKWMIYPLVKYVFGVIRVPDMTVKRSAPELDVAVHALDAGKCLVIFPEGFLQRKEDQPLRRFGRGVWEILKARPDTPVIAAWIEGGWGSFFSYQGGPPIKGKRPDFRRPIDVGYAEPFTVPKDLLDDHWATRFYLMNKVGAARALVGQPRIPEAERPKADDEPI